MGWEASTDFSPYSATTDIPDGERQQVKKIVEMYG